MGGKPEFREVHDEFRPRIRQYLSRLAGPQDADDITQEVFEKVSRSLKDFRGESKLSTWLYRIATNTAMDRLRSEHSRRSSGAVSVENSELHDRNVWTGEDKSSIELRLIRTEMNSCIRDFIMRLSPDHRAVLVLGELEGLKNKEIAEILKVSVETVKIRRHRARASLKKELEDGCTFYRDERNVLSCDLKSALDNFKKSS
jgi:RNA polymerase sigma-70 factor (ECF subfamily)